jgi:hypothetical protein
MKLFPWIPQVEIADWQEDLRIRAVAPHHLRNDVQTLHSAHTQDTDFENESENENAERTDSVFGAFTWSFSLKK